MDPEGLAHHLNALNRRHPNQTHKPVIPNSFGIYCVFGRAPPFRRSPVLERPCTSHNGCMSVFWRSVGGVVLVLAALYAVPWVVPLPERTTKPIIPPLAEIMASYCLGAVLRERGQVAVA